MHGVNKIAGGGVGGLLSRWQVTRARRPRPTRRVQKRQCGRSGGHGRPQSCIAIQGYLFQPAGGAFYILLWFHSSTISAGSLKFKPTLCLCANGGGGESPSGGGRITGKSCRVQWRERPRCGAALVEVWSPQEGWNEPLRTRHQTQREKSAGVSLRTTCPPSRSSESSVQGFFLFCFFLHSRYRAWCSVKRNWHREKSSFPEG